MLIRTAGRSSSSCVSAGRSRADEQYRQTRQGDFFSWTYLGPLISERAKTSFSEYSGNWGNNFETHVAVALPH